LTFDPMERTFGTSMAPPPSSPPPLPGDEATLQTVDILVLVAYFMVVMAVGIWVSLVLNKSSLGYDHSFC